jgi:hypothetical protein
VDSLLCVKNTVVPFGGPGAVLSTISVESPEKVESSTDEHRRYRLATKKLDKKMLFWKQAAVIGVGVEALVSFKVVTHYAVAAFNGLLTVPSTILHYGQGLVEQVAHAFGA